MNAQGLGAGYHDNTWQWQDPSWGWEEGYWDSSWSGVAGAAGAWDGWWSQDAVAWPNADLGPKTVEDERNAQIHFTKTYQVLSEAIEKHPAAFKEKTAFMDLGCAPGGFSQRMLEELGAMGHGYGITLPYQAGGFPMLLHDLRFHIQVCNLMEIQRPKDLECPEPVDVIMADAQDLS
ncbi:unnamed protein product [Durusdinium trenchii]|uniref:Ribosomal RNA methyltransferase FtsJ domain-containing protein n=1 Tax=Durusdinium trenchii TaxID=1381693 RepID=A0ABP0R2H7_9DINO